MISKTTPANLSGKVAETIACDYLTENGIVVCDRNFRSRFGEIDIIALDRQILLFIEVRFRKNEHILAAIETIDQRKCKKIIMTSEYYLNKHRKYRSYQCRYDVITITGELQNPAIKWIKNAFQA